MSTALDTYFHRRIRQQPTLESAAQVLAECATALGWDLVAFHAESDQSTLPRASDGSFIATALGWPSSCVDEWVRGGLGHDCPVGQRCTRFSEPFVWECDPRQIWFGRNLNPEQRRALELYGQYVSGGVAIPVRRAGGKAGYVSWSVRRKEELHPRHEETLGAAYLISHTFIHHMDRLSADVSEAESGPQLTARELECLTWAARGKTEDEIGIILQRSPETVHFHLRNTAAKLSARNRTQAVAIACSRGLVSVR